MTEQIKCPKCDSVGTMMQTASKNVYYCYRCNKDFDITNIIKCPKCGSTEWTFSGWQWRNGSKNVHRRRCSKEGCGYIFVLPAGKEGESECQNKEKK
jgi:ribosomal protein S27AE